MRKFIGLSAALLTAVTMYSCNETAAKDAAVELTTTADSVSYLIGNDIANSLKGIKDDITIDIIFKGIKDQLAGGTPRIPAEKAQVIMKAFSTRMRDKQTVVAKESGDKNKGAGAAFLKENGVKPGVITTASGLQYSVITEGKGPIPSDSARVKVHYKGTLIDGKEFDSSYKRGEPAVFPINGVIKGWTEVLKLMKVGSKYNVVIPSELGYGERGAGADIGPNATLIFEVELLGIEK